MCVCVCVYVCINIPNLLLGNVHGTNTCKVFNGQTTMLPTTWLLFQLCFYIKENTSKWIDIKRIYWLSRPNIPLTVKYIFLNPRLLHYGGWGCVQHINLILHKIFSLGRCLACDWRRCRRWRWGTIPYAVSGTTIHIRYVNYFANILPFDEELSSFLLLNSQAVENYGCGWREAGSYGLSCKPVEIMELFYSSHPCLTTDTLMRLLNVI